MIVRVTLTGEQRDDIARGRFVKVTIAPYEAAGARARSVLVGRTGEALRAYANVCRHQAVPLDLGMDTAMADDGHHLLCHQHGALYRPDDGMCIAGPCKGAKLVRIVAAMVDATTIELEVSRAQPDG